MEATKFLKDGGPVLAKEHSFCDLEYVTRMFVFISNVTCTLIENPNESRR